MKVPNSDLTLSGLQLSYELIFLKAFLLWENFCEDVFTRLVCGFASNGGREPLKPAKHYEKTLDDARLAILAGRDYQAWHSPGALMNHADRFFDTHTCYFRQVIAANQNALRQYAAVRHRIAHAQDHAIDQFNDATMDLAGRRFPGASPGRFLRSGEGLAHGRLWLDEICDELVGIAHQFC